MNICFVNSTSKWGGVKSWTLDVARGLADRGHRPMIVGRPGPFIEKACAMGLDARSVSFGPDFNPLRIIGFMKLFKASGTDLVVVNVGKDMRTAGIAAKFMGIPVIHRAGLAGDMMNTYKVRLLHKWIRPRILVPCEHIKQGLLKELPYLLDQEVSVVLTGKEPVASISRRRQSPLKFVSTSQLNEDKGHRDMLRALHRLKADGFSFEYHVVGTGRIDAEVRALAASLDLDDRVVWHGFQKDVRSILRCADVFLLPSEREGLPNSLLEAMAEGLVCIARNTGGIAEIWPREASAFLISEQPFTRDSVPALATVLNADQDHFFRLKEIFWRSACDNSLAKMIDKLESIFTNHHARN